MAKKETIRIGGVCIVKDRLAKISAEDLFQKIKNTPKYARRRNVDKEIASILKDHGFNVDLRKTGGKSTQPKPNGEKGKSNPNVSKKGDS